MHPMVTSTYWRRDRSTPYPNRPATAAMRMNTPYGAIFMIISTMTTMASLTDSRTSTRGFRLSSLNTVSAIPRKRAKKMICSMSMLAMAAKGFLGMMLKRSSCSPGASWSSASPAWLVPPYSLNSSVFTSSSRLEPGARAVPTTSPRDTASAVATR
jgi:hypothetical protein